VPEYPWDSPPLVVDGRLVHVYALIDADWLAQHPGWMTGLVAGGLNQRHAVEVGARLE
jgi:hypothetical protein